MKLHFLWKERKKSVHFSLELRQRQHHVFAVFGNTTEVASEAHLPGRQFPTHSLLTV